MKSTSRPRTPSALSDSVHRQLNMYALAASAAGVGVLALAQPAEGKIIYTKTHVSIGPGDTFHLDLTHDGVTDFDLKDTHSSWTWGGRTWLSVLPAGQKKNQIWGHVVSPHAYASALYAGVRVGPKGQFLPGSGMMAATSVSGGRVRPTTARDCWGAWAYVNNRYLGLKFLITGEVHFGWARLNVSCGSYNVLTGMLTGYAYETVPNRPIVTGKERGARDTGSASKQRGASPRPALQPVGLGRLAQGAAGLGAVRK